jgi:hypothetical protein
MTTTTESITTTVPTSLVETHELAGLLVRTIAVLGFVVEYVTVSHHTYPWGDAASVSVQVDDPASVAAFLGGLNRIDYDVDGEHRYYYTGQWRGISLHVGPLAE